MHYLAPVLVVIALLLSNASPAAEGHTHGGAVGKFYQSWTMPTNRSQSCCHDEDCAPAQSKMVNGKWYARHTDADDWAEIPPQAIETERDSPDGRSHLCGRKYQFWGDNRMSVFCFLPAGGS